MTGLVKCNAVTNTACQNANIFCVSIGNASKSRSFNVSIFETDRSEKAV